MGGVPTNTGILFAWFKTMHPQRPRGRQWGRGQSQDGREKTSNNTTLSSYPLSAHVSQRKKTMQRKQHLASTLVITK